MNSLLALLLAIAPPVNLPAVPAQPVHVDSLQGLVALETQRVAFLDGFRDGFAEGALPREIRTANGWRPDDRVPNRFRLVEEADARDAWRVRITLRLPKPLTTASTPGRGEWLRDYGIWLPPRAARTDIRLRAARGMIVSIVALRPHEPTLAQPTPDRFDIVFPLPDTTRVAPERVYAFPWDEAGRATARLTLEVLHRRSRDLRDDGRFSLPAAVRFEGASTE